MKYVVALVLAAFLAVAVVGCGGDTSIQKSNEESIQTKATVADQVYMALKPSIGELVYPGHGSGEEDGTRVYLAQRALDVTESKPEWNAKQPNTTSMMKDSTDHPGNVERYLRYEFKDGSALNLVSVPVGYGGTIKPGLQLDRVEIERP